MHCEDCCGTEGNVIPVKATVTWFKVGWINRYLYHRLGVAEHCDKGFLPTAVEVTPTLLQYNRLEQTASVQLSNLSSSSVMVPPGGLICQIQACGLDDEAQSVITGIDVVDRDASSILNKIDLSDSSD